MGSDASKSGAVPDGFVARQAERVPVNRRRPPGRLAFLVLLGALVAGLLAFGIGEVAAPLIPSEKLEPKIMGPKSTIASRSTTGVVMRTSALQSGILGACLAGCLGTAGGLARRSALAAMLWGTLGLAVGLALGAGLTIALFPWYFQARELHANQEFISSMILHGAIWAPLGAVSGLALAFGSGQWRRWGQLLIAGLLGALLGAVACDVIGAILFPLARTADPVAETWLTFLTSRLLVTLGTALLLVLGLSPDRRPAGK